MSVMHAYMHMHLRRRGADLSCTRIRKGSSVFSLRVYILRRSFASTWGYCRAAVLIAVLWRTGRFCFTGYGLGLEGELGLGSRGTWDAGWRWSELCTDRFEENVCTNIMRPFFALMPEFIYAREASCRREIFLSMGGRFTGTVQS